ncbi:MAG: hypothetical protein O6837_06440, partial [Deltaproteobacteria bacterium]|nr:hypothetical protein [Deltaproteobacteria bacterium]
STPPSVLGCSPTLDTGTRKGGDKYNRILEGMLECIELFRGEACLIDDNSPQGPSGISRLP